MHFRQLLVLSLLLLACVASAEPERDIRYARSGTVRSASLDELSGLAASRRHNGVLWTHNDDGKAVLFAINAEGDLLGQVRVGGASNQDWEDLAMVPGDVSDWLIIGDFGEARPDQAEAVLYLVEEPEPGADRRFSGKIPYLARLPLRFPGSAEDIESMAWDPLGQRLLLLAKRSQPPRLFGLNLGLARNMGVAELSEVGTVGSLRPPQPADQRKFGKRTPWISQPTGLDISPDGTLAAVITYRSLYLFRNPGLEDWAQALQAEPLEIIGPPAKHEEAVTFTPDGQTIVVTSEGVKAPVYTYRLQDW
jgi:hypothetical protein